MEATRGNALASLANTIATDAEWLLPAMHAISWMTAQSVQVRRGRKRHLPNSGPRVRVSRGPGGYHRR